MYANFTLDFVVPRKTLDWIVFIKFNNFTQAYLCLWHISVCLKAEYSNLKRKF